MSIDVLPLPYPFDIAIKREFILAYYAKQWEHCPINDCPICDIEFQDALTIWETILSEHRGQRA